MASNLTPPPMPRGIRNNNPLNLEHVPTIRWDGELVPDDGNYCRFKDPVKGLRAGMIELHNYMLLHGLDTIRGLITRWAPPEENATNSYIEYVSAECGIKPDYPLEWFLDIIPVTKAMVHFENGVQPYTDQQFEQARVQATTR